MRLLEKDALAAYAEHKLIVSMRLYLTQMLDKVDSLAPTQVMWQFAVEKILMQRFEVLTHGCSPSQMTKFKKTCISNDHHWATSDEIKTIGPWYW
jgi:hypothetical protein